MWCRGQDLKVLGIGKVRILGPEVRVMYDGSAVLMLLPFHLPGNWNGADIPLYFKEHVFSHYRFQLDHPVGIIKVQSG